MIMLWPTVVAQAGESPVVLEPAGMAVMGLSILIVAGLTLFCISRIWREKTPGTETVKGQRSKVDD